MKRIEYEHARDAAWQTQIAHAVSELPVRVSEICKAEGYQLTSYTKGKPVIDALGLSRQCQVSDGFALNLRGAFYIFYNETMPVPRIRFTIAHELGHIKLNQVPEGQFTPRNKEPSEQDDPIEQMANAYAARLLAPAIVLHELNVIRPEEIAKLCGISMTAARYRAGRMGVLQQRGRFGTSALEREVLGQFRAFIERVR